MKAKANPMKMSQKLHPKTAPKDVFWSQYSVYIINIWYKYVLSILVCDGKDHRAQGIEPSSKLTTCTNVLPVTWFLLCTSPFAKLPLICHL